MEGAALSGLCHRLAPRGVLAFSVAGGLLLGGFSLSAGLNACGDDGKGGSRLSPPGDCCSKAPLPGWLTRHHRFQPPLAAGEPCLKLDQSTGVWLSATLAGLHSLSLSLAHCHGEQVCRLEPLASRS